MKKTWIGLAVVATLVAATIGWSGQAPAQTKSDTPPSASVPSAAPEKIEGTVTGVDAKNGMGTLRGNDGPTDPFVQGRCRDAARPEGRRPGHAQQARSGGTDPLTVGGRRATTLRGRWRPPPLRRPIARASARPSGDRCRAASR